MFSGIEEIHFQVWLKQQTFTVTLMSFTEKSSFCIPDSQTQEKTPTPVKVQLGSMWVLGPLLPAENSPPLDRRAEAGRM